MTRKTPTTPASTSSTGATGRPSERAWAHSCKGVLSLVVLVVLSLALGGCASRYEVTKLGGVVVHTITHAHANMHVVVENGHAFAVDAGMKSTAEDMELDLQNVGVPPESLKAIVVSHGHHDHAGGARFFQKKYGTKIVAGRADLGMMQTGKNELICPVGFVARMRHAYDSVQTYDPVIPDMLVDKPTSLFELTGVHADIVPIPSHTAGSLTVVVGHAALVGDLFRGGMAGAGAEVHFYMCDVPRNRRDIQSFLAHEAREVTTFFPGHFGPVSREEVVDRFVESEP